MMRRTALVMTVWFSLSSVAMAQGLGEIVRIQTATSPRCINAKTDEITVTLRRIITHKTGNIFTEDKRAGVTIITTLNSDGNPQSKHPSVNLVSIEDAPKGQVRIPLEYPIASLLSLSPDSGKTYTKNMLFDLYLDKPRGKTTFGEILDSAGNVLGKLPLPPNPYVTAANTILQWANTAITNASKENGGQLFASITFQFNNRPQPDIQQCKNDGFETTGAVAVISPEGSDQALLKLGNLNQEYCWRYATSNSYEVLYAPKPGTGCEGVPNNAFKEVPNDYVMAIVTAATTVTSSMREFGFEKFPGPAHRSKREVDLVESAKLCDEMNLSHVYCGIP